MPEFPASILGKTENTGKKFSNRIEFVWSNGVDFSGLVLGSVGGNLSPVTTLALNSLTGMSLNSLQESLRNAYSSLQQYAGKFKFKKKNVDKKIGS